MTAFEGVRLMNGSPNENYYAELTNLSFSIGGSEIQKIDAQYIPVDGESIWINSNGELTTSGGGGGGSYAAGNNITIENGVISVETVNFSNGTNEVQMDANSILQYSFDENGNTINSSFMDAGEHRLTNNTNNYEVRLGPDHLTWNINGTEVRLQPTENDLRVIIGDNVYKVQLTPIE